ncbi:hypothetical protein AMECASPLE_028852 [Ameca splendens]|uniref:NAC domain-containing protein n=1 Tax=Ameca splendens TaxID=208324 RepID=A0ABV0Z3T5_9TELE
MSSRRHPIISCAVLTTHDTSFLSCAVPTPHCHAETQTAFHRGPVDICKQLRREKSLFSFTDEEELLLYLLQQVGGVSSPGEVRGDVDALVLQAVQSRPSITSHSIHREECVQSSWTSSNPLTTTVSDGGPHRPHQKAAFVGLFWGSCVFLQKSTVKL